MLYLASSAIAVLSLLPTMAVAQTFSDCNPLNTTDCPSMEALGGNITFDFTSSMDDSIWPQKNDGEFDQDSTDGAEFTVLKSGDSPQVDSKFYLFFGRVEVIMQASNGTGMISSAILQSEDLDEIEQWFKAR